MEIGVLVVQNHALAKVGAVARPTQDNVYVVPAGRVYIVKISAKRGLGALIVLKLANAQWVKDATMYQENAYHVLQEHSVLNVPINVNVQVMEQLCVYIQLDNVFVLQIGMEIPVNSIVPLVMLTMFVIPALWIQMFAFVQAIK